MAGYEIRSLASLSQRARGYFTQAVEGAIVRVWANTFTVFAKVMALLDFEHEQRRAFLYRQLFASTADAVWLARHAFELGLARGAGTPAFGRVRLTAVDGLVVPAGLVLVRTDGPTYTTPAPAIASGASVVLYVEADAPGAAGNCPAGEILGLSPDSVAPDGLGAEAAVLDGADGGGLAGGIDPETVEAFRARVLGRKRNPPHGGAAGDYEAWLREVVPSAAGVWVDSFVNDPRSVWVAFTVTDQPAGIPSAGQVALAQAALDDPVRRPVTARVFVVAPVPVAVPLTIRGLTPDTPDVRDAVAAEVAAVFLDRAEPGQPRKGDFVLSQSWLAEAVARATGEDRHHLVSPADDLVFTAGTYPVPGPISYA